MNGESARKEWRRMYELVGCFKRIKNKNVKVRRYTVGYIIGFVTGSVEFIDVDVSEEES